MLKILSITGPIFIIIAVGFAAVRMELFSKPNIRALGLFVINFALPALLFKALSQRGLADIVNVNYLLAYASGSLAAMFAGISIAYFGRKKGLQASAIYGLGMCCSNSGFIGYPIALQVVGSAAAVALALCMIVENMLMLPLAMTLAESGSNKGEVWRDVFLKTLARLLRNPFILAIIAGFIFAILEIRPPEPVSRAVDMLALASAPVALFVIGGTLVGLQLKGMMGDVSIIVVGKLMLHPLAVFAAVMLLPSIDPELRIAAVVFACVPMLSIYPIIGQKYQQEALCAAALMAATLASFITISGVLWLVDESGVFAWQ